MATVVNCIEKIHSHKWDIKPRETLNNLLLNVVSRPNYENQLNDVVRVCNVEANHYRLPAQL